MTKPIDEPVRRRKMDRELLKTRPAGWKGDWSEREAEMGEKIGWLAALLYVGVRNLIHSLTVSALEAKAESKRLDRPGYGQAN
jgi:hypothetical protein